MKTLVAAFLTALGVFLLATGWIELVQPQLDWVTLAIASKVKDGSAINKTSRMVMTVRDEDDEEPIAGSQKISARTSRGSRPNRQEANAAEKARAEIAVQMEEVKKQEAKLVAREENLRMLYDDIRTELAAIEELRRRSATELAIAEQKVQDAAKSNTNTISAANDLNPRALLSMKPEKSAQNYIAGLVQDLANRGSIDTAAGLLRGMKDREIAKVLTALSSRDPQLANQLFEQVRTARQESTIRR